MTNKHLAFLIGTMFWLPLGASAQNMLAASVIHENPCSWPQVQSQLKDKYNSEPQFTAAHGKLVKFANMQTVYVNLQNNDLQCNGDFTYVDGTTRKSGFGMPVQLGR